MSTMFTNHPAKQMAINEGKELETILKKEPQFKTVIVKKDPYYDYYNRNSMKRGVTVYNRSNKKSININTASEPFQNKEWDRILNFIKTKIF